MRRDRLPTNAWSSLAQRRIFFDSIKQTLQINKPEDWYKVTSKTFGKAGGRRMLENYYGGSLAVGLKAVYPDHEWQEWRFINAPRHFWNDIANQRRYITWFEQEVGIKTLEDWYKAPIEALNTKHGTFWIVRENVPVLSS
jgi:hypothetical protein